MFKSVHDGFRDLLAFNLKELVDQTDNPKSKKRIYKCKNLRIRYHGTTGRYLFLVRCKESYSDPKGHIVSINFDYEREEGRERGKRPFQVDVRLRCMCPAFLYWGSEYIATQLDYNTDDYDQQLFPKIRDPELKNLVCKHVISVRMRTLSTIRMKQLEDRYRGNPDNVVKDMNEMREKIHFKSPVFGAVYTASDVCFDEYGLAHHLAECDEVEIPELEESLYLAMSRMGMTHRQTKAILSGLSRDNFESRMITAGVIV